MAEGDGRVTVHAGNAPETGATIGPFNKLGERVEWRTLNDEPFAIIYRLVSAAPEVPDASVLFVSKIGKGSAPSCLIAQVGGDFPGANRKARALADAAAAKSCADIKTQEFGKTY